MLDFEQKINIIESFPELQRKDVSLGRVNYHYEQSVYDKKTVVYHLHPNGNGYVYAGQLRDVPTDDKGFVNIREYSAEQLRSLIAESIRSLSVRQGSSAPKEQRKQREVWTNADGQTLLVTYEDELWYVFAGDNLESAFETYEEVEQYMQEEAFTRE